MKIKALKRLICGLSALVLSFMVLSFNSQAATKKDTVINSGFKLKTIIIDAGHGGKHSSTIGHFSPGASGAYSSERNVTLAIAFKLQAAIEKDMPGIRPVLTRNTDEDVDWQKRSDIANQNKGDVFISLHCNALPDRRVREVIGHRHKKPIYRTVNVPDHSGKGVLMLVYRAGRAKEEANAIKHTQIEEDSELNTTEDPNDPTTAILINEYKRKFRLKSVNLANLINNEFVQVDGRKSGGVIEQGVLVLCHSAMPSVLVETGFIDNPVDEAYLNSENGQNEIVDSIIRALKKYKDEVEQVVQQ
jgi:N-acetylmuramoyl-L-alanine amidase